jgi:hypothetical protein
MPTGPKQEPVHFIWVGSATNSFIHEAMGPRSVAMYDQRYNLNRDITFWVMPDMLTTYKQHFADTSIQVESLLDKVANTEPDSLPQVHQTISDLYAAALEISGQPDQGSSYMRLYEPNTYRDLKRVWVTIKELASFALPLTGVRGHICDTNVCIASRSVRPTETLTALDTYTFPTHKIFKLKADPWWQYVPNNAAQDQLIQRRNHYLRGAQQFAAEMKQQQNDHPKRPLTVSELQRGYLGTLFGDSASITGLDGGINFDTMEGTQAYYHLPSQNLTKSYYNTHRSAYDADERAPTVNEGNKSPQVRERMDIQKAVARQTGQRCRGDYLREYMDLTALDTFLKSIIQQGNSSDEVRHSKYTLCSALIDRISTIQTQSAEQVSQALPALIKEAALICHHRRSLHKNIFAALFTFGLAELHHAASWRQFCLLQFNSPIAKIAFSNARKDQAGRSIQGSGDSTISTFTALEAARTADARAAASEVICALPEQK